MWNTSIRVLSAHIANTGQISWTWQLGKTVRIQRRDLYGKYLEEAEVFPNFKIIGQSFHIIQRLQKIYGKMNTAIEKTGTSSPNDIKELCR